MAAAAGGPVMYRPTRRGFVGEMRGGPAPISALASGVLMDFRMP